MLFQLIDIYSVVVLAAVVLSWVSVPPGNAIAQVVHALTEPLLGPIRRALPAMGGLDFSPMILLILLQVVLKGLLRSLLM